jgi:hypothetical protein
MQPRINYINRLYAIRLIFLIVFLFIYSGIYSQVSVTGSNGANGSMKLDELLLTNCNVELYNHGT